MSDLQTPAYFWPIAATIVFAYLIFRAVVNGSRVLLITFAVIGVIAVVASFILET